MKLFFKNNILSICSILFITSCKSLGVEVPFNRKIISDDINKEVFFVTDEKNNEIKDDKFYFWYKSQKVHKSVGGYSGQLLDGNYVKYFYSNELAEQGKFKEGLKVGEWKEWHKNGKIQRKLNWFKGRLKGMAVSYDSVGNVISKGKYKSGIKDGVWIYPMKKDTIFYRKGKVIDKSKQSKFKNFLKKIFENKEKKEKQTRTSISDKKRKTKKKKAKRKKTKRKRNKNRKRN